MRARGCLFGLLGIGAGLALLGQGADVGARHLATSKVEERVRQAVPEASGVHARILSWPFLQVGVNGDVHDVTVRVTRVVEKPLVFTDVVVDLHGVRVSVSDLTTQARVNVIHVDRGTIVMTVTESSLEQALAPGAAGLGGVTSKAVVSVNAAKRLLVIAVPGVAAVDLPLPKPDLLPCVPQVTQSADRVMLGCQFTQVPSAFTSG